MHEQILTLNPERPIAVHVIWFGVLAGDDPSDVDPSFMPDARVRQYWDPGSVVSSFLLSHQREIGFEAPGDLLWDAYLLFGPEATWSPVPLVGFGFPVVDAIDQLTDELAELWGIAEAKAA